MLAIQSNEAITWGDVIVVLVIAALIIFCIAFWNRRR
jgi:hypothetical protein